MAKFPCVALIIENPNMEVLLLLRDDKTGIAYPNTWSLVGGHVENGETAEQAALRELFEEVGLALKLTLWKNYDYHYAPEIVIDQHIFLAKVDSVNPILVLGEGQALRFYKYEDTQGLKIGFDFEKILKEYFENKFS